jgi:hypothetical protein
MELTSVVQRGHGQEDELTNEPGLVDKYISEEPKQLVIRKLHKNLKGQRLFIVFSAVELAGFASKT